MIEETSPVVIKETGVLEKFEGEPLPENLFEKMYIEDGKVVKIERFENGELVDTEVKEVD